MLRALALCCVASGAMVEIWSPLNNSVQNSSVPVFLGVFVEAEETLYSVCLSLLEASGSYSTLTCRPVESLGREEVNLDVLPGRRRLRVSLVRDDDVVVATEDSTFRVVGDTDITAASNNDGWFAACPKARSESEARSQYFDAVYETRFWTGRRSEVPASGPGSTKQAAANAIRAIERIVREFEIDLLLDAPCGDGSWIGSARLPSRTEYVGVDVSAKASSSTQTIILDLVDTQSVLETLSPLVTLHTLILCRHLLFHLPSSEGLQVIRNLKSTRARWLLTSTYLRAEDNERDFVFADGHKTNLMRSPYFWCLGDPLELYRDAHPDQYLALYDLHDDQVKC